MRKFVYSAFGVVLLLLATSCNNQSDPGLTDSATVLTDTAPTAETKLTTLDTIIPIVTMINPGFQGPGLTEAIAETVLYTHYQRIGYYIEGEQPSMDEVAQHPEKMMVGYDTIYYADLNGTRFRDAIITYWICPPYSSGHCLQPSRAVIMDSFSGDLENKSGYEISNENFIPVNYAIDSVVDRNDDVTIYGYDYDCANHKMLRKLKIRVK